MRTAKGKAGLVGKKENDRFDWVGKISYDGSQGDENCRHSGFGFLSNREQLEEHEFLSTLREI